MKKRLLRPIATSILSKLLRRKNRFTHCSVVLILVTFFTVTFRWNRPLLNERTANMAADTGLSLVTTDRGKTVYNNNPSGNVVVGLFVLTDVGISDNLSRRQNSEKYGRLQDQELGLGNCDESPGGYRLYIIYIGAGDTDSRRLYGLYIAERVKLISQHGCQVTVASESDATTADNYMVKLNEVMIDAYLNDHVDYFHVITPEAKMSYDNIARKSIYLINKLRLETDLYETGVVVEIHQTSPNGQSTPVAIFFSRVHFDIFGVFFPLSMPDLSSAISLTMDVHLSVSAIANLTVFVEQGKSNSRQQELSKTSSVEPRWPDLLKQNSGTLQLYLSAAMSAKCFRCPSVPTSNTRVISMSLYGSDRRYTMGAIRNAQLAPVTYPGWQLRFFTELPGPLEPKRGVVPPEVLDRLRELGAVIYDVQPPTRSLAPMLWRFTVIDDPTVDVFIVRDCDSRLTTRDASVVSDWLKQDSTKSVFHCIRDHPSHSSYSVSGGLWGARRAKLSALFNGSFSSAMVKYGAGYVEDMHFLGREVWPRVQSVAYCHDSFSCRTYPASHPFPVKRIGSEHLGQVYDQFSVGRQGDIDSLVKAAFVAECNPH